MSRKMVILVGPPGSGKSSLAQQYEAEGFVRVSQDDQGKGGHVAVFKDAVREGKNIIVDRMNFSKEQRNNYLFDAKYGYETEIIVLHQPYKVCLERMLKREGHPTIQDEKSARSALQTFFSKYERPVGGEADKITFVYPNGLKQRVLIVDLDGSLCDCEHRRHFVRRDDGQKKDWVGFFKGMSDDAVVDQVATVVRLMSQSCKIVYCSGRPDDYKKQTVEWLERYGLDSFYTEKADLYMRMRHDSRQDNIVKEILLDFEILTRYTPYMVLDDRAQVVEMWRKRGLVCFQVAPGEF